MAAEVPLFKGDLGAAEVLLFKGDQRRICLYLMGERIAITNLLLRLSNSKIKALFIENNVFIST